jgi:hypothetical protein
MQKFEFKIFQQIQENVKGCRVARYVKDVFMRITKNLGFKETKEGVYGVDITWEKPSEGVSDAIEHENDIKSIWNWRGRPKSPGKRLISKPFPTI